MALQHQLQLVDELLMIERNGTPKGVTANRGGPDPPAVFFY
jgi:hypothetical protein